MVPDDHDDHGHSKPSVKDGMDELTQALALLLGEESAAGAEAVVRPCFCQGTKHARHPFAPLCTSCGLILCAIVSPSPLVVEGLCPSCGQDMLDERSRAMLIARLDERLARLVGDHEEAAARIRRERELARAGRRHDAELFPQLHAREQRAPSSSGKASGFSQFHNRRRQVDIAMGRRIDDSEETERRVRVLRIGAKPHAPNTAGKKKASKGKKAASSDQLAKTESAKESFSSQSRIDEAGSHDLIADEAVEANTDEQMIHFDKSDDPLAPMSDPYDDGFRRRWMGREEEADDEKDEILDFRWTPQHPERLAYIPPEQRLPHRANRGGWRDTPAQAQETDVPAVRHVPGSRQAVTAA